MVSLCVPVTEMFLLGVIPSGAVFQAKRGISGAQLARSITPELQFLS
jgi:hypothetical protein